MTAILNGQIADASLAKSYILAGKATVTLVSVATGTRFTYRISATPDGTAYFVSLLNGPDNTADFKYLGRIAREVFYAGRRVPKPGEISPFAPSSKAFAWTWQKLVQGTLPTSVEVWHEGRCGRCARKLTVPSSVASGMGPECAGKAGFFAAEA